jgi:hypothetical protein
MLGSCSNALHFFVFADTTNSMTDVITDGPQFWRARATRNPRSKLDHLSHTFNNARFF